MQALTQLSLFAAKNPWVFEWQIGLLPSQCQNEVRTLSLIEQLQVHLLQTLGLQQSNQEKCESILEQLFETIQTSTSKCGHQQQQLLKEALIYSVIQQR
mmetsp:Transcript_9851/g.16574  ORF Transcript_9851/g.16574 Transcript_9851/m.16574 type:complete len:99 (+) Transcript_9851:935-1231(+)